MPGKVKRSYSLRTTHGQSLDIFGREIAKKSLEMKKVAKKIKSCQEVAEQLVESPP